MTKRSAGIGAEEHTRRQAVTTLLIGALNPDGMKTRRSIEAELELPVNKLTEICRQATRKRWKTNKTTGASELVETKPGVLDETDFAFIAGKGYDKGRGRLTDKFIFELGLGQLVESVQVQRGSGLTDTEEAEIDEEAKAWVRALLNNRHKAQKIFTNGLDNIRRGDVPWARNGRRKRWANATSVERRASFNGWLDEIEQLGCRVLERGEWQEWFELANPSGTSSTIEQFLWYWSGICDEYSFGCPPWIWRVDVDYWDSFDALSSGELLDSLILITESDMPYSTYHTRFEHPSSKPRLRGYVLTDEVTSFSVIDGELQPEPDSRGDDIEAWITERRARVAQATQEANALIDRASRRKSGGAHG
ncbi:hypothetical protein [Paraburkholderia largidicola]|uniref:Uncharacterized protein n=1 Tax=Paraburkholderia largidicola TaxID=3014751 RepID=A0A7I8BPS7_9BURK|nr:hypothetical protein [Paraburkholderia sp. PGU16]BCF90100.1 hypothetical protein PPGU16_31670 [Paraburkholderia sp. PGU16]